MPLVRPVLIASDADKAYRTAYVRMKRTDAQNFFHRASYVLAVNYGNDRPDAETQTQIFALEIGRQFGSFGLAARQLQHSKVRSA